MSIDCQITDTAIPGFSHDAQKLIQQEMELYGLSVVRQAKQIDERYRDIHGILDGKPDVTLTIATQAITEIRPSFLNASRLRLKMIRCSAAVFSLVVGLLHTEATGQGGALMLLYVLIIALALLFSILSVLQD